MTRDSTLTPGENEEIERALDRQPDWPPRRSATGLSEGERRHGSTGQLFEVNGGQWKRVREPTVVTNGTRETPHG